MKHVIFIGLMIVFLLLIFSNHVFSGDLIYTERGKYTVKCFIERDTDLHCFKRPIEEPSKKPATVESKKSMNPFDRAIQEQNKKASKAVTFEELINNGGLRKSY